MSEFNQAFESVLAHEGGFVNHKADKGGATAFGISLRFLRSLPVAAGDINGDGHVDINDILAVTPEDARAFYKRYFWDHYRLGEIQNQQVATKLFNFFVNMRGTTAALVAQRAANDLGAYLSTDGVMGSLSIKALNGMEPSQLLVCIKWRAWEVYRAIVDDDPEQAVFMPGWRNRAFSDV
jgi:lysozyme family protein